MVMTAATAPSVYPLTLSLLAGLSTTLGALMALLLIPPRAAGSTTTQNDDNEQSKERDEESSALWLMSGSLALAASVMVTVTVVSIAPECLHEASSWQDIVDSILCFALGGAAYSLIANVVFPAHDDEEQQVTQAWLASWDEKHHHHHPTTSSYNNQTMTLPMMPNDGSLALTTTSSTASAVTITTMDEDRRRAWRLTLVLFPTLALHNFPEGLAVAASTVHSARLGQATAVAIALHNIPEGLVIAAPALRARPDAPWLAVGLASLSGLAEPLGAWVTVAWLQQQQSQPTTTTVVQDGLPNVLALVGGIMFAVACLELFPEAWWYAKKQGNYTPLVLGVVLGAVIMMGTEFVLAH